MRCTQPGLSFDDVKACIKDVTTQCAKESKLIEEFDCEEGLTESECLDIYTIALYHGKVSEADIMAKIRPDN